jgi:hypothetical protein
MTSAATTGSLATGWSGTSYDPSMMNTASSTTGGYPLAGQRPQPNTSMGVINGTYGGMTTSLSSYHHPNMNGNGNGSMIPSSSTLGGMPGTVTGNGYGAYMTPAAQQVSALSLHHISAPSLSPSPSVTGVALQSSSTLGGRKRARAQVVGACRSRIARGGRVVIDKYVTALTLPLLSSLHYDNCSLFRISHMPYVM